MNTYYIFTRHAGTKFKWYKIGTTRAKTEKDAWSEVRQMENRTGFEYMVWEKKMYDRLTAYKNLCGEKATGKNATYLDEI